MFFAGEVNNVEPVAIAKRPNAKQQGLASLLHFAFLGHGTTCIQHENDVLADQLFLRDILLRRKH